MPRNLRWKRSNLNLVFKKIKNVRFGIDADGSAAFELISASAEPSKNMSCIIQNCTGINSEQIPDFAGTNSEQSPDVKEMKEALLGGTSRANVSATRAPTTSSREVATFCQPATTCVAKGGHLDDHPKKVAAYDSHFEPPNRHRRV